MRTTIRTRILLIFVGIALFQALLMGAFFLWHQNISQQELMQQQLTTASKNLSAQVSIFLNTILHDLEIASQQVERMAQKDYQRYNLLKTITNNSPVFSALAFYDINGTMKSVVANKTTPKIPDTFAKNSALFNFPYYSGMPYVTPLNLSDKSPALGISQPVFFMDKSYIIGVISALVPYQTLQTIVDQTVLPAHMNILIVDAEERILATTGPGEMQEMTPGTSQKWDGTVVLDGIPSLAVSTDLLFHGQKLTMVAIIGTAQTLAPAANHFFTLLLCTIVLLLLVAALVGLTTHRKIISPLQQLAQESTALLQGRAIEIPVPNDVELQDVAKALNLMNSQLKESNKTLEKEVVRRRHEEKNAITAKIEAEKANQAKSIFLANMTHEIRTPLQAMLGMFEMLDNKSLNSDQQHLLGMATLSGKHLHTVVNNILDLSQIESGTVRLHRSPFLLSELSEEVLGIMQVHADKKSISLTQTIGSGIPSILIGDSGRIRQILINLLNNSVKFSTHGTIELSIQLHSLPSAHEAVLQFSIKDQGKEIPEGCKQVIFDAFNRGEGQQGCNIEGSGLGLAISSEFVQHMQGRLWLESSDKNGSTFCFTILCQVPEVDSPALLPPKPYKKLAGIRIFLAEDEFINQRIISAYLEEQGCTVTVCADGQELLDAMKVGQADLILMDIRMPVLNGLETTKIIRSHERDSGKAAIPIVALTAQATADFESKCRAAGMDDYLTKPIPFERLVSIIWKLVKEPPPSAREEGRNGASGAGEESPVSPKMA